MKYEAYEHVHGAEIPDLPLGRDGKFSAGASALFASHDEAMKAALKVTERRKGSTIGVREIA